LKKQKKRRKEERNKHSEQKPTVVAQVGNLPHKQIFKLEFTMNWFKFLINNASETLDNGANRKVCNRDQGLEFEKNIR